MRKEKGLGQAGKTVRALSSLTFGAYLLVCLLVAMAAATVYESMRGTEQALLTFYQSPWFIGLLVLLCLNVLAALLVRFPWPRAKIGFVVTHASVVVILLGALVTKYVGIEGQVALVEGEAATELRTPAQALMLTRLSDRRTASIELPARPYAGLEQAGTPGDAVRLEGVRAEIVRFVPDSTVSREVSDAGPREQAAVQVSLAGGSPVGPRWVFAGHTETLGEIPVSLEMVNTDAELAAWLEAEPPRAGASIGTVAVTVGETTDTVAVEECRNESKPVLGGRYSIRVLEYFPHATVGADHKVTNASSQPMNPAIRVEVTSPAGTATRLAFARFPDFHSMHRSAGAEEMKIVFHASGAAGSGPRIEIRSVKDGPTYARFVAADGSFVTREVARGAPTETVWPGRAFALMARYDRAWLRSHVRPVEPPRETRSPAIEVAVHGPDAQQKIWLQRHQPRELVAGGSAYRLAYQDRTIPLGFSVKLDKFTVGYYPGGRRPRSFESRVTITDPSTGRSRGRVIRMDHPTTFNGYTFYQSSYQMTGGQTMSVLSVAWDPGQPVVFAGYIGLLGGMLWVLGVRVRERRRLSASVHAGGNGSAARSISLLSPGYRCRQGMPLPVGRYRTAAAGPSKNVRRGRGTQTVGQFLGLLVPFVALLPVANAQTNDREMPSALDLSPLRGLGVQHDGRWMPLDTVARDVVDAVTGSEFYRDRDPLLWLLTWTFDARGSAREPLITIRNAELRRELQLTAEQTKFSYNELVNHGRLRSLFNELAQGDRGRKLDPLESKVSDIHEKLIQLQTVFSGQAIRVIPDADDPLASWAPFGTDSATTAAPEAVAKLNAAWRELGGTFLDNNRLAFAKAAKTVVTTAGALPAAHRPSDDAVAAELRYNRLDTFAAAWKVMVVGVLLAGAALFVRRRWFDAIAFAGMLAGFVVLTYGLSLRWQIAGRIPASNMFESLLFLSWGMGAFAVISIFVFKDRLVPLTASGMGAVALLLANVLPLDHFIRPIAPVLLDTVWMSIHVPVIMVSYSVLALAVLVAHVQLVIMAAAPGRTQAINLVDGLHYWYVHVGSILLAAGIITGSMWAASSWGRYWGWDPKEVWSLVALLGYLTILHVRIDHERVPPWVYVLGGLLCLGLLGVVIPALAPLSTGKLLGLLGTVGGMAILILAQGQFATAAKSILCFWLIIMTYVGVNYVLGIGLHSYGFGTGAVARYMFWMGGVDLAFVVVCTVIYLLRRGGRQARGSAPAWGSNLLNPGRAFQAP